MRDTWACDSSRRRCEAHRLDRSRARVRRGRVDGTRPIADRCAVREMLSMKRPPLALVFALVCYVVALAILFDVFR